MFEKFEKFGKFNKAALEKSGLREGYYFISNNGNIFIAIVSKKEWPENTFEIRDTSRRINSPAICHEAIKLLMKKKESDLVIRGIYIDLHDKFKFTY